MQNEIKPHSFLKSEMDKIVNNILKLWVTYTRYFLLAAPHEKETHPRTQSTRGQQGPAECTLKQEVPLAVPVVPWLQTSVTVIVKSVQPFPAQRMDVLTPSSPNCRFH